MFYGNVTCINSSPGYILEKKFVAVKLYNTINISDRKLATFKHLISKKKLCCAKTALYHYRTSISLVPTIDPLTRQLCRTINAFLGSKFSARHRSKVEPLVPFLHCICSSDLVADKLLPDIIKIVIQKKPA